ncbi:MAG: hypothetical protein WCA63_06100 [Gallionella sp.]
MKNRNGVTFSIASAALLSILSFPAIADSSTPVALKEMIQLNAGKQLAAEGNKYTEIVSLAGSNQDELTARRYEAVSAYKKWYDLKSDVVKHYPTSQDYRAVEIAAKEYSHANKAFIDLQKSILANNNIPLDKVTKKIIALE